MIENKTILVVDDDPKIATLLQTYLEECGFAVHTVSNGQLCIDFLSTWTKVDAVVLDVMMPVMDGFITLQEIRRTSQDTCGDADGSWRSHGSDSWFGTGCR